jgi:Phage integrase, N-terminal SAM-like domain
MSEKPISPLRRRMIEDMTVRNFAEKTRNDYIRHVRTFTTFLGRAPDTAAPEDLRLFQLHQTQAAPMNAGPRSAGPKRKPNASALVGMEAAASVRAAVSTTAILRNFSIMTRLPLFIWR